MPRRQTVVYYEDNWAWPGKPWPWCKFAQYKPDFPESNEFGWFTPPHDHHIDNGGNTWCPGVEGEIEVPFDDKYIPQKVYPFSELAHCTILHALITKMQPMEYWIYTKSHQPDTRNRKLRAYV